MNCEELDGFYHCNDGQIDAKNAVIGEVVGLTIRQWLGNEGKSINSDTKMLGLGAGEAVPELACAQCLGILDNRITLVERGILTDIQTRLNAQHSGIDLHYGEGLFHFLQNTQEKYDLVTAFSLEHVFQDATRLTAFINLVSQRMKPERNAK